MRAVGKHLLASWFCVLTIGRVGAAELTERDYFGDLPEVLTVTRLAQPLANTPGAVTVIERETIRRSGAREVADVLRLAPGYLIGGINGAHPSVAYHAPLDDYGVRNLVLIDGRSTYNSYYLGDTSHGLMGVRVEDIERIEVLRGSNSAAYGANAMFGVVNIVTRHAADTRGGEVAVTRGDAGAKDGYARIGWGDDAASFRLSAGQDRNDGLKHAYDNRRIDQVHFRGDFRPAADQDIQLTAGSIDMALQAGTAGSDGDPFRNTRWRENFLKAAWRKHLSASNEVKLSASYDEVDSANRAPYPPDPTVTLDTGGHSRKLILEFQHQIGLTETLRAVWGLGYERNEAKSAPLFYRHDAVVAAEERLFGNLEWLPHERWVINAGGYLNRHNWVGTHFSPRLMANFHATPDQTLRFGATQSFRTPSLLELAADVRYYPRALTLSGIPLLAAQCRALGRTYCSTFHRLYSDRQLGVEKLDTTEIGYFGNFGKLRMALDVRGFVERMSDRVTTGTTTIPGYVLPLPGGLPSTVGIPVETFRNGAGFQMRGELAVATQAANGNYPEYLTTRGFEFERRTFGSLRLEF